MTIPTLLDKSNILEFISSIDYILTDCDGVIWRGQNVIPGTPQTLAKLKSLGKQIFYVSNNSTKTIKDYVVKLKSLGFSGVNENNVFSSAVVTSIYVKKNFPSVRKVYVIGSEGLMSELKRFNPSLQILWTSPDVNQVMKIRQYDPEVGLVVVGFDSGFNYEKLTIAMGYLKRNNCRLLVSNADTTFPANDDFLPGTGSIVSSVITASNQQPIAICGKPSTELVDMIGHQVGSAFDRSRTLMIGDRLNTDILMSNNASISHSLLVLTGCDSDMEDVRRQYQENSLLTPKYYINSLADIKDLIDGLKI